MSDSATVGRLSDLDAGDFLYIENIGAYSTGSSPDGSRDNGFEGAKIIHKKSPASAL